MSRRAIAAAIFAWCATLNAARGRSDGVEPAPRVEQRPGRWTRARLARCAAGDATACQQCGYAFRIGGDGAHVDRTLAARFYARAWSLRSRRTEQDLLPLFEMGVAAPADRAWYREVCDRGGGYACGALGAYDLAHAQTRRTQRAALDLLERAAGCPQVRYFYYGEDGLDVRARYRWYYQ